MQLWMSSPIHIGKGAKSLVKNGRCRDCLCFFGKKRKNCRVSRLLISLRKEGQGWDEDILEVSIVSYSSFCFGYSLFVGCCLVCCSSSWIRLVWRRFFTICWNSNQFCDFLFGNVLIEYPTNQFTNPRPVANAGIYKFEYSIHVDISNHIFQSNSTAVFSLSHRLRTAFKNIAIVCGVQSNKHWAAARFVETSTLFKRNHFVFII